QIFILQDQVDARASTAIKRPSARVEETPRTDVGGSPEGVEYAGAAKDANAPRPVLRLVGNQAPKGSGGADDSSETSSPMPPHRIRAQAPSAAVSLYANSIASLRHGQHAEALAGLHGFLAKYPTHEYASNAQYWIGECYYDQKDYASALREFRTVVEKFGSG